MSQEQIMEQLSDIYMDLLSAQSELHNIGAVEHSSSLSIAIKDIDNSIATLMGIAEQYTATIPQDEQPY